MPKGARDKGRHAGAEAGLLAAGRHAPVNVVAQPVVGVHVPPGQVRARVLGRLDHPGVDVLQAVPRDLAGDGVDAVIAQAGQDAGTFGQGPDAVELETCYLAGHVDQPHALEERALDKRRVGDVGGAELARQGDEEADPDEACDSLLGGGGAAARNLALLSHRRLLGRVNLGGHVEHGRVDPAAVLGIVKGRAGKQRREEEHVGGVVDKGRQVLEGAVLLQLRQLVGRQLAVGDVPAEGGQLHDEHHLGSGDVDDGGVVCNLALDVADGHVAHEEDEADPGHVGAAAQVLCDGVGAAGADGEGDDAIPEVEEADEVEERDAVFTVERRRGSAKGGQL